MLANELMSDAFDRIKQAVHTAVKDLSEKELIYRPNESANSIAWLVWHLARVQDDHMADLANTKQLWDQGWREKFDLPFEGSATGYGHSAKDVAAVKPSAKLLLEYYDAVHQASLKWISDLKEADYLKVIDEGWNPPVTLAVRLVSIITDDLEHAGQAAYVHGLIK